MANLQLKTVSKVYPSGALALYKVNLQLSDSEFVAVVGGEKCGKSTLLRVIAGIEEATEGQIIVGGKDVTGSEAKDRDLAMIFQGNSLYPSLNVFDNMAYGLKVRKTAPAVIEQRVKAAAEILGLNDILYRKPKALTLEQKQRVAFARAIVREPKIYLLDDPLSGIDPAVREKLQSILINLQMRMKGTFLYATKNVNDALTMATRIIVLKEGFVQQIDTPANLYEYPANAYVAFTLGSPTVNFVNNAVIERDEQGVCAVAEDVRFYLPQNIVDRFKSLEEYAGTGKKVILGVRPEDMTAGGEGFISATVSACEEICGVTYADCECGKLSFVVKSEEEKAKGDEVNISADLTHAFIFDSVTRLTLLERDGGYTDTGCEDANFIPLGFDEEEALKNKLKLDDKDKKKKK